MELVGARVLVLGATGTLGSEISRSLARRGARLVLGGRDQERLAAVAGDLGGCPTERFDAERLDQVSGVVDRPARTLGGLDLLVVTSGIAGFGAATATDMSDVLRQFDVNTLAPIAAVQTALPYLAAGGGTVAVVSATPAGGSTGQLAAYSASYSASKAAVSTWLDALHHEQRGAGVTVYDIRPSRTQAGVAGPRSGAAPSRLPDPIDTKVVVEQILTGLEQGHRELILDLAGHGVATAAPEPTTARGAGTRIRDVTHKAALTGPPTCRAVVFSAATDDLE